MIDGGFSCKNSYKYFTSSYFILAEFCYLTVPGKEFRGAGDISRVAKPC
jgi:hypothetical protein